MTPVPRVLVIDDSATIVKVVTQILTRSGFAAEAERDAPRGLERLETGEVFDLVLLDFVMPRMNGYQFCRELRSRPALRAQPVVLMSAKADKVRDQFLQQTGALDAITKPFDARALVAVVQGALAKVASGRSRIVPEGETMPDDQTFTSDGEELRPSLLPRRLLEKASDRLVEHVSQALLPVLTALPPSARADVAAVERAITQAIEASPLDALLLSLRDAANATTRVVLSGDLGVVPLPEVLQLLQMQRQTGQLRVTSGERATVLHVRDGALDLGQATGDRVDLRLGRHFVELELASRDEVEEAAVAARRAGRRLGEHLVATGRVGRERLTEALSRQSSEIVYDVLRWPFGRFWFTSEPLGVEAVAARLGLGMSNLLLEGFRRVDEWRLMEAKIDWDQVLTIEAAALESMGTSLTRAERRLLDAIDGRRTVNEIVAASELSSFDAVKMVFQFLGSRVLRGRA